MSENTAQHMTGGSISTLQERHGASASRFSLLLKNCNLLNVYTCETCTTDIAIVGDTIVSIDRCHSVDADEVIDCTGLLATPGLIDPHMHVDTTFLWPGELARVLVPLGTTTVFVDTINIAHTGGAGAVNRLRDAFAGLPLRGYFAAPSYCPFNATLETAAANMTTEDICGLLDAGCVSIGETVWSRIALGDTEYMRLIQTCREAGQRVSGHGGEIRPGDEAAFDAYAAAGMQDDHCIASAEGILPRLRRGFKLFMVEASGRRGQLRKLLDGARGLPLDQACLCIDNITAMDMLIGGYGYLDHLVRIALDCGLDPHTVFRMGALNTAEHYRVADRLGSVSPGRCADILLLKRPDAFPPEKVIVGGRVVAERGVLTVPIPQPDFPAESLHSIRLDSFPLSRLTIPAPVAPSMIEGRVRAHVIRVEDGDAFNADVPALLPVRQGAVQPDLDADILKIAIVERYGRTECATGVGFVNGFGLRRGALATSVSVPSNNIVAVGVSDEAIRDAVLCLRELQGGFVVVEDGKVLASVALPVDGIMAVRPCEEVVSEMERAQAIARELGCGLQHPFFTLAQTVLSTLPDLGLTDKGLVNARLGQIIPVVMEQGGAA